jgi:hypothetical protein
MDRWAWQQLDLSLELRPSLSAGAPLCVIHGPTSGRHWEASAARKRLKQAAETAGVAAGSFGEQQARRECRLRDAAEASVQTLRFRPREVPAQEA